MSYDINLDILRPVKKAVDDFVKEHNLKLYIKHDNNDPESILKAATDWWFVKQ